jgi:hypothetical protein
MGIVSILVGDDEQFFFYKKIWERGTGLKTLNDEHCLSRK